MKAERSRQTAWAILLFMGVCLAGLPAHANDQKPRYSGGYGTEASPYKIATAADLILLGESPGDYSKHFVLTADIDLDPNLPGRKVFDRAVIAPDTNDASWEYEGIPFTGTFNGADHTISHMTIAGSGHLGLFGQLGFRSQFDTKQRATVQIPARITSLGVVDANIVGWGHSAGAMVAHNDQGMIAQCYSSGAVKGDWSLASGLVGANGGTITDCHSTCAVSGSSVGGLVGDNSGTISRSHSTGMIESDWRVGGLVGINDGRIMDSYSTSVVSGHDSTGGLVGENHGSIMTSYSSGTVSWGDWDVGGLVGRNSGSIAVCWSDDKVTGHRYVGGLVGGNEGSIAASYSTGVVHGHQYVGGLVGGGGGIAMCYSTAKVTGNRDVGGLTGDEWFFTMTSFWDTEVSGQPRSGWCTGLTTAQMKDPSTFLNAGWDLAGEIRNGTCDYWQIAPGEYPRLTWFEGNKPEMPDGLGTVEQPYLIRNARDLGTVWFEPVAHYRLAESVDLSGIRWSMAVIPVFGGTFNGDRHRIDYLHIQGDGWLGFFGQVEGEATISNLRLEWTEVNGAGGCVGGLAAVSRGTITGCHNDGLVKGYGMVGGLVGRNHGSIAWSRNIGVVTGGYRTGGLAGSNEFRAAISTSHSAGTVEGYDASGGLVGGSYGSIALCSSACAVSGSYAVGGLLGKGEGCLEEGRESNLVTGCYGISAVIGEQAVGGLIGHVENGRATRCYSIGAIRGDDQVGGLAGYVTNGNVSECYSASAVSGKSNAGALVGAGEDVMVTGCLWDTQACGQAANHGGIGRTTAEMQTTSTFTSMGWDFEGETPNGTEDIWWIDEGLDYPRLWWEIGGERGEF